MKVRIAVSALLAIALSLGASGCNLIQPQATTHHYDASDGISANVGDLQLRNLILISNDGQSASLLMSAINTTGSNVMLRMQFLSKGSMVAGQIDVPTSNSATSWGSATTNKIIFDGIDTTPGSMLQVYFQYGDADGKTALIPVLTSRQPEYKGLQPATELHIGTK